MEVNCSATREAKTRSTLLTIPVEVRHLIYRHLFHKLALKISSPHWEWNFRSYKSAFILHEEDSESPFIDIKTEKDVTPFILGTCHQIRNEALPILSSNLTLYLDNWKITQQITPHITLIPSYYLQNIKKVVNEDVRARISWTSYKFALLSLELLQVGTRDNELDLSFSKYEYLSGDEAEVLEGKHDESVLKMIRINRYLTSSSDLQEKPPFQIQFLIKVQLRGKTDGQDGAVDQPKVSHFVSGWDTTIDGTLLTGYSLQRSTLSMGRYGTGAGYSLDRRNFRNSDSPI